MYNREEKAVMKKIFPFLILVVSAYWMYKGVTVYRLWAGGRLGGGFMPAFAGLAGAVFSLRLLFAKEEGGEPFRWKAFLPVLGVALVIAASYAVGLVLSLALFIFFWLKVYEKVPFGKSALTAVASGLIVYLVFVRWLLLPFPRGLLNLV